MPCYCRVIQMKSDIDVNCIWIDGGQSELTSECGHSAWEGLEDNDIYDMCQQCNSLRNHE